MLPINTLNGVELGMEWGKEDHPRSKCFHSLLQQCFAGLEVFLHLKNLDQLVLLLSWIFNLIKKIITPYYLSPPRLHIAQQWQFLTLLPFPSCLPPYYERLFNCFYWNENENLIHHMLLKLDVAPVVIPRPHQGLFAPVCNYDLQYTIKCNHIIKPSMIGKQLQRKSCGYLWRSSSWRSKRHLGASL